MLTSLLQLPAAGTKLHGHSTATSLPCGNRNGFIRLTATQETKPSIRYPNNPLQDGGGACGGGGASRLATFVIRLYCAPLVGICKRQQDVNQGRSEDGDRGTLWRGLYPQNCHPFNFNEVRNSLFGCHGDDGGLGCVWGGGGSVSTDSPGSSWLLLPISPTKELILCPRRKMLRNPSKTELNSKTKVENRHAHEGFLIALESFCLCCCRSSLKRITQSEQFISTGHAPKVPLLGSFVWD